MADAQLALRFISGKYQGGEFPLKMDREIIIGRSSDLDMVLVEDMVSRKHAKISTNGEQVMIQDLGSTNGTFVNGEKIKRVRLREGDRILIGTSIIKLVAATPGTASSPHTGMTGNEPQVHQAPKKTVTGTRSMAGTIDEIPLPDLLQLLSTSKKSGVLEIHTDAFVGRIYLRKGQIYFGSINDDNSLDPRKAIYRLLTLQSGAFELQAAEDQTFENEIDDSTEGLLMEAMRLLDEINRLDDVPDLGSKLSLATPMQKPLRDLTPEQLDTVQAVLTHGTVQGVLDAVSGSDLDAYNAIAELVKENVLQTSD